MAQSSVKITKRRISTWKCSTINFLASINQSPTQMGSLGVNNSVTNISSLGTFKGSSLQDKKKSLLASISQFPCAIYIVHLFVLYLRKKIQSMAVPYQYACDNLGLLDYCFEQFSQPSFYDFNSHILNSCAPEEKKKMWVSTLKLGNFLFFFFTRFEFSLKWVWPRFRAGFQCLHLHTSSSPKTILFIKLLPLKRNFITHIKCIKKVPTLHS